MHAWYRVIQSIWSATQTHARTHALDRSALPTKTLALDALPVIATLLLHCLRTALLRPTRDPFLLSLPWRRCARAA